MYDLLTHPIVRVRKNDGLESAETLPGLMALLMRDEALSLKALQHHQKQALHALLVQLGTAALEDHPPHRIPESEGEWRELLQGLAPRFQDNEPWHLVQPDITVPAFMQAPGPDQETLREYTGTAPTPRGIDVLVTSKNHDVKQHSLQEPELDDWLMALVTLQTMENASGRRPGTSRMKDGTASRVSVSIMPLLGGFGAEVRRDITALRQSMPVLREKHPRYPRQGGLLLTWTETWQGTEEEQLQQEELHPLYIDTGRRMRLIAPDGKPDSIRAIYVGTGKPRVSREPKGGLTGDPWAPVETERGQVLALTGADGSKPRFPSGKRLTPEEGFSYRNITRLLLSPEWEKPPLLEPTPQEREMATPMRLVARCIRRSQGKTFGYDERVTVINHHLQRALNNGGARLEAGEIAMGRIRDIDRMEGILKVCLSLYMEGGSRQDRKGAGNPGRERR